jgi:hypothetical protein
MVTERTEHATSNALGLSAVSRWVIAVFSLLFGIIMFAWAQGQELWKYSPAIFCFIIAAACVLPQPLRALCGDVVAVCVILLTIWFFYAMAIDPDPGAEPIRFATTFGLPAFAYLAYRYGKCLAPRNHNK